MNLIKVEIKKNLKGCLIWGLVLSAILFLYMAFFPSMAKSGLEDMFSDKMNMLPKGMMDTLGLSNMPNFSNFMEYFAYVYQFIIIGLAIYAMILGTSSLSKEEGEKTIEFLYSKPVTRIQIVTSKIIGSLLLILINALFLVITSIIADLIFSTGNHYDQIILVTKVMLIPVLVYWAVGFAISSFLRNGQKSIVIALGIFFGTYLLGFIANTIDALEWLKYLSPINYNIPINVYRVLDARPDATLNIVGLIIAGIIIVGGIITTFIKYNKKDIL